MPEYRRRIIDGLLDDLLPELAAIALEGAKGVGKTATASQRAATVYSLQNPDQREILASSLDLVAAGPFPVFIDEWQLYPAVWDRVKTAVDDDPIGGRFLLAGSADTPPGTRIHSGAGRIDKFTMRPMSLVERGFEKPTVSLAKLLRGESQPIAGTTERTLRDYVEEIFRSGFPGIRDLPPRARRHRPQTYVDRIVEKDIPENGGHVREPESLRAWLYAYSAATSTDTTYETILNAATPGQSSKPSQKTALRYRDLLTRLFILDPIPAWSPSLSPLSTLTKAPKHHLVDPAIPAHLVGIGPEGLIQGERSLLTPDGSTWLGSLFESLAAQSVRVYAQASDAKVRHLRTKGGRQEIDLIVEDWERNTVAIEVKLAGAARNDHVKHLNWLQEKIGTDRRLARVVITSGTQAYQRADGVAVVPLALLGP